MYKTSFKQRLDNAIHRSGSPRGIRIHVGESYGSVDFSDAFVSETVSLNAYEGSFASFYNGDTRVLDIDISRSFEIRVVEGILNISIPRALVSDISVSGYSSDWDIKFDFTSADLFGLRYQIGSLLSFYSLSESAFVSIVNYEGMISSAEQFKLFSLCTVDYVLGKLN